MGNKQANSSSNLSTRSVINGGQLLAPQNRISRRGSELRARQPAESVPNEKSQINGSAFDSARQSSRRRWSSVATVSSRNTAIKPKRLLPRQCHLIIKSWNKKVPKVKMVKDVFCAIFTEAEELKQIFGIPMDLRGKKLRSDPKFVAHTTLFTDTLTL
uniref:Uncharacterized protein n=1 Tax=Ditylenchus dipsaci TaxID=166011 RepID=A0A915D4R3_9BILA